MQNKTNKVSTLLSGLFYYQANERGENTPPPAGGRLRRSCQSEKTGAELAPRVNTFYFPPTKNSVLNGVFHISNNLFFCS
jgi:hypothetical protein